MKKKFFVFSLMISLAASLSAQNATLPDFNSLSLNSYGTIYLSQAQQQAVKINGEESLDMSKVHVKDGMLYVDAQKGDNIYVSVPALNKLLISGKGEVIGQTPFTQDNLAMEIGGDGKINMELQVKSLKADISGLGKITLKGTADESSFNIAGSGKVDAIDLKTSKCTANISGLGKCSIDVTESLNSNISGSGSVMYKSRPANLVENISGVGKIGEYSGNTPSDTTHLTFGNKEVFIIDRYDEEKKKKKDEAKPIWGGLELGLNSYLNADNKLDAPAGFADLDLRQEKSVSVSLNLLQKNIEIAKSNVWFFTGLGITWNNYRFDNNVKLLPETPIETTRDTSSNFSYSKSKLTASYLTLPIMFEAFTSRDQKHAYHFGAGAMLGLRIGSHTKQKYELDGKTYKPKTYDDFNLNPVRYGVRVTMGYGPVNIFADYYASTLFKDKKGPSLYPVNIGITLVDF